MNEFCYLGDMISAGGGVEECVVARIRVDWKKFTERLPVLNSKVFPQCTKGKISFGVLLLSVVLNGSETWAVKEVEAGVNDMMMVQWISNKTMKDRKSFD